MELIDRLNQLAQKNDYLGMATVLKGIKVTDAEQQKQLNNQITQLERYGGIANKLLNSEPDYDKRDKLAFSLLMQGGSYGEKNPETGEWVNPYARQFTNLLNELGNGKNPMDGSDFTAHGLKISFASEENYKEFLDKSGLNFGPKDEHSQAFSEVEDGRYSVNISKSLLGDMNFFKAFYKGLEATNNVKGEQGSWVFPNKYIVTGMDENWDKEGAVYTAEKSFWTSGDKFRQMLDLVEDVNNTYNETVASKYDNVIPTGLQVSGYINDKQRQIINMVGTGRLEREMGNFMLKQIDDYYSNQLSGISLTGFSDVYATEINDKTKNLRQVTDSETLSSLTDMIRAAAKENRVSVRAATSGGRVGASITIAAKLDKDGKPVDNYGGAVELFIPGLFEKDARNVMDQDIDAKLLVEKSEHIAFNHSYFLEDGGHLTDFQGDGAAVYEDDVKRTALSPEQVDMLMRQNEMIKSAASQVKEDITNGDATDDTAAVQARKYAKRVYSYINNIPEDQIDDTKNNVSDNELGLSIDRIVKLILNQIS